MRHRHPEIGDARRPISLDTKSAERRHRALLHDEIAQTVDDPAGVAEELRELRRSLAS